MSGHVHEYQLEGDRRYYYCECGEACPDSSIEDLWEWKKKNQTRIKALEGVVEAAKKLVGFVVEHFSGCTYTKSMSATSCSCGISGLLNVLSQLEEV